MTRIDFHSNVPDKLNYTCRLIRKARAAQCKVVVFDSNKAQLEALNNALWTFSEADFLPHVMAGNPLAEQTPIILTYDDTAALPHHQILINLTDISPSHFDQFERMIEIISMDDSARLAGRERYRFYQQQGHTLSHTTAKTT
ncbi:DNA polymerase III subunit chi [Undibacterium sp. Jales W-56]|uniref:DNA polymerase III subunit chi n=1 Tax=Undibacterium sp. Jales W-56 TaxID=2897325 RepID=UPI0021D1F40A|nr:DNA polymerase III subunit chi [Undibacterium sp. Jales W-56]MCU6432787.1 DNA polymerase III subunit chi [Undibacterium sp. Jales W-56]